MSNPEPTIEEITPLVSKIFHITDITAGKDDEDFIVRYRGKLIHEDSAALHDQLWNLLTPLGLTPLFRMAEDGTHIIYVGLRLPPPPKEKVKTNIILFVLTIFSVMLSGVQIQGEIPPDFWGQITLMAKNIFTGWQFAASLLSILLAHELGHYFMSRYHKTPATLPFFIPFPLSPLGTMGAAILMRGIPKNKRVLFDIGVAGPLAGLVVAVPILFLGLSLSTTGIIEPNPNGFLEGNSLLYLLAKFIIFGKMLPEPAAPQTALYWIQYFFTGKPVPFGGLDVFIHPVAFAGWAGILVTALNLIPAGSLDGGHIIYSLFGEKARKAFPYIIALLVVLGFAWNGWWIWAALLFWLGRQNAQPLDQITTLDPTRRAIAYLMIIIFFLVFMPVPFMTLAQPPL